MTVLPLAVTLTLLAACGPVNKVDEEGAARSASTEVAILGEDGQRRSIQVGQIVEVRLPAQIAAGMRWDLAEQSKGLVLTDSRVEPRLGTIDGSSDLQVFRFRATTPGVAELRFDYRRPWQRDRPAVRSVSHRLTVAP